MKILKNKIRNPILDGLCLHKYTTRINIAIQTELVRIKENKKAINSILHNEILSHVDCDKIQLNVSDNEYTYAILYGVFVPYEKFLDFERQSKNSNVEYHTNFGYSIVMYRKNIFIKYHSDLMFDTSDLIIDGIYI